MIPARLSELLIVAAWAVFLARLGHGFPPRYRDENGTEKSVNLGRRRRNCTICAHEKREEIEREFINRAGATAIAEHHGIADHTTVYRHAHAFGLFAKQQRNVRAALEKIIEKAGEVEVTSAAVVAAVQAYTKINAQGQWVDRSEHLSLNELFERMTPDELERYGRRGELPSWFTDTVPATRTEKQEAVSD